MNFIDPEECGCDPPMPSYLPADHSPDCYGHQPGLLINPPTEVLDFLADPATIVFLTKNLHVIGTVDVGHISSWIGDQLRMTLELGVQVVATDDTLDVQDELPINGAFFI